MTSTEAISPQLTRMVDIMLAPSTEPETDMDTPNQPTPITGYRVLNEDEVKQINALKECGQNMEKLINVMRGHSEIDQRWLSIGATHLQQGIMALVRSIAKPTSF